MAWLVVTVFIINIFMYFYFIRSFLWLLVDQNENSRGNFLSCNIPIFRNYLQVREFFCSNSSPDSNYEFPPTLNEKVSIAFNLLI